MEALKEELKALSKPVLGDKNLLMLRLACAKGAASDEELEKQSRGGVATLVQHFS